jgi:SAM-dependent methyltransferase
MISKDFYFELEKRFRGSRELILERLKVYSPILLNLKKSRNVSALDLGCGRGEWLELLSSMEISASGVDLDEEMLKDGLAKGFQVYKKDALEHLKSLPHQCLDLVTGFHIIEHLELETLIKVLNESFRVIRPGGLIIFETPNPENVQVGSHSFYLDPTHERPLPPSFTKFLVEYAGFQNAKIFRLNSTVKPDSESLADIQNWYLHSFPDYSILATKDSDSGAVYEGIDFPADPSSIMLQSLRLFDNRIKEMEAKTNDTFNLVEKLRKSSLGRLARAIKDKKA